VVGNEPGNRTAFVRKTDPHLTANPDGSSQVSGKRYLDSMSLCSYLNRASMCSCFQTASQC
jgi:hypothetical protein